MTPLLQSIEFDPFAGDYSEERILQDSMVKARKAHTCFHCKGPILVGEVHRSRRGIVDEEELMSWRWCAECCAAMVLEMESTPFANSRAFEDRLDVNAGKVAKQ